MSVREEWKAFDALEISPIRHTWTLPEVVNRQYGESGRNTLEQCEEDDPNIFAWTVYGHFGETSPHHGVEALVDCPTKEIAEYIAELIGLDLNIHL